MSTTTKPVNQKAWFLILPVLLCVAFSAIIPLMTVVNYSVQDIISPERRVFVGTEWFKAVMRDDDLQGALLRQITFSLAVLAVEIPLGILLALSMPAKGWQSSAVLVTVAISLLIQQLGAYSLEVCTNEAMRDKYLPRMLRAEIIAGWDQFERDLAASEPVTLESWQRRPITTRAKEMFARLWEYWL